MNKKGEGSECGRAFHSERGKGKECSEGKKERSEKNTKTWKVKMTWKIQYGKMLLLGYKRSRFKKCIEKYEEIKIIISCVVLMWLCSTSQL